MSEDRPIVIAHRGASGYLPEHTLPAVSLAFGMDADYIEQDVVLSKDGIPVVLHDVHIDTVTDVAKKFPKRARADGRFYAIDFTLTELQTLRVNERVDTKTGKPVFPRRFPQRLSKFSIATLGEELELIQGLNRSSQKNVGIYPEIKNPAWHREQGFDISRIVVQTLADYGYKSNEAKCYLQCFDQHELMRIKNELGVKLKLVQLLGAKPKHHLSQTGLKKISTYAIGIGPPISTILNGRQPTNLVQLAHDQNLKVHPYTFRVDALPKPFESPQDLMSAAFEEAKVDGMFSDFPDVSVKYLQLK